MLLETPDPVSTTRRMMRGTYAFHPPASPPHLLIWWLPYPRRLRALLRITIWGRDGRSRGRRRGVHFVQEGFFTTALLAAYRDGSGGIPVKASDICQVLARGAGQRTSRKTAS